MSVPIKAHPCLYLLRFARNKNKLTVHIKRNKVGISGFKKFGDCNSPDVGLFYPCRIPGFPTLLPPVFYLDVESLSQFRLLSFYSRRTPIRWARRLVSQCNKNRYAISVRRIGFPQDSSIETIARNPLVIGRHVGLNCCVVAD